MMETLSLWVQLVLQYAGAERYSEHAICLTNDPAIIIPYQVAHLATGLSYFVIGLALIVSRKLVIPMTPVMKLLFGSFIFLCGLSHFTDLITMYYGAYRFDLLVTMAMAGVSTATALVTTRYVLNGPQPAAA